MMYHVRQEILSKLDEEVFLLKLYEVLGIS